MAHKQCACRADNVHAAQMSPTYENSCCMHGHTTFVRMWMSSCLAIAPFLSACIIQPAEPAGTGLDVGTWPAQHACDVSGPI